MCTLFNSNSQRLLHDLQSRQARFFFTRRLGNYSPVRGGILQSHHHDQHCRHSFTDFGFEDKSFRESVLRGRVGAFLEGFFPGCVGGWKVGYCAQMEGGDRGKSFLNCGGEGLHFRWWRGCFDEEKVVVDVLMFVRSIVRKIWKFGKCPRNAWVNWTGSSDISGIIELCILNFLSLYKLMI